MQLTECAIMRHSQAPAATCRQYRLRYNLAIINALKVPRENLGAIPLITKPRYAGLTPARHRSHRADPPAHPFTGVVPGKSAILHRTRPGPSAPGLDCGTCAGAAPSGRCSSSRFTLAQPACHGVAVPCVVWECGMSLHCSLSRSARHVTTLNLALSIIACIQLVSREQW